MEEIQLSEQRRLVLVSSASGADGSGNLDSSLEAPAETGHVQASELLAYAEELAQIGGFDWDIRTDEIVWTDGLYEIYGLDPLEFEATLQGFMELVIPEDRPQVQQAVQKAMAECGAFSCIERVRHGDGGIRYLESRGRVLADESGQPARLIGVCRDVTERIETERASRWQIIGLRMLAESAGELIATSGRDKWLELFKNIAAHLNCQAFANYVFEDGRLRLRLSHGYAQEVICQYADLLPGEALCGQCASSQQMVYMPSHELEQSEAGSSFHKLGVRAYVGVPLLCDGQLLGTLCFTSFERTQFADYELHFINTVGQLVAAALAREHYEREINQRENRYRSLAENIADGLILFDPQGQILDVNRQACESLGYERGGLVGQNLSKICTARRNWAKSSAALSVGATQLFEDQLTTSRGVELPVEVRIRRVSNQGGDLMLASVQDLSERQEMALQKQRAEETATLALEYARMLTCEFDASSLDFALVNGAEELLLGYSQAEWLSPGFWMRSLHDEDRPQVLDCLSSGCAGVPCEFRMRRKDATYAWLEMRIATATGGAGDVRCGRALMVDITPRKQLEEQLRHSQKMEAIGRLAGGIAHDFNNLLTVINTYAELIELRSAADSEHLEPLKAIQDAAERAHSLTSQLLMFSRNAHGNKRVVDINKSLEKATSLLSRLVEENVRLETDLAPALPGIRIDPSHLDQVIINLAVNSRDAMPAGGVLRFSTELVHLDSESATAKELVSDGDYVLLRVRDTGCGMSENVRSRVFEPFFTTKREGKGTGLGLAVVYAAVQECGGSIEIGSQIGEGTEICILFPATSAKTDTEPEPSQSLAGQGQERILLVEDEDLVRRSTAQALKMYGYKVLEARSAAQARQLLAQNAAEVDLLLTDMVIPDSSGLELATSVANDYPGIRVVCMSGYSAEVLKRIDAPEYCLPKPFRIGELVGKVRGVLDGRDPGFDVKANGTGAADTGTPT